MTAVLRSQCLARHHSNMEGRQQLKILSGDQSKLDAIPVLSSGDVRSSQFRSPGDFDSSREYEEHRSSAKLSGCIKACVPIVRFNHLGELLTDSGLANFRT